MGSARRTAVLGTRGTGRTGAGWVQSQGGAAVDLTAQMLSPLTCPVNLGKLGKFKELLRLCPNTQGKIDRLHASSLLIPTDLNLEFWMKQDGVAGDSCFSRQPLQVLSFYFWRPRTRSEALTSTLFAFHWFDKIDTKYLCLIFRAHKC